MSSIINLCDSSDEEDVKPSLPADDSSSSSSSDDEILHAPSIFSQGSNTSKAAAKCSRNDSAAMKGEDSKPVRDEKASNCYTNFGRKREQLASTALKSEAINKKPKPNDDVIELLGSSSDDDTHTKARKNDNALSDYFSHPNFANKVARKSQVRFDSSDDNNSIASDASADSTRKYGKDWTKSSTKSNPSQDSQSSKVHNPYKTNHKKTANDSSCSESNKKQTSVSNPYNRDKNSAPKRQREESDASSATLSLPDGRASPARLKSPPEKLLKQSKPKEIDLSMDTSDDGGCSDDNRISQNNHAQKDDKPSNRKSVDWSFEITGGFDEDSNSDFDTKPKAAGNSKPTIKQSCNGRSSFTLRDRIDKDHIELGSDNDSSDSSHMPMFTPKSFKKTNSTDAASTAAAAAAASFALSASKSGENLDADQSSPELMTPRAFSPPSNSPLTTFAVKKKVPVPAIPAMPPELIREIGGKLYPDLKHSFLIALAHHARKARHASYERGTFDSALRSIIVICMHLRPLRSAEATRRIKGVGGSLYELLKDTTAGPDAKAPFVPRQNKYSCVAAAALVALLELEEENDSVAGQYFPMEVLIRKTNQLLDSRAKATLDQTVEKYLDPNTLDPNWGQVKKLCSTNSNADLGGPFIKERKKKQACTSGVVFELLDIGREMASKLRDLAKAPPVEPGPLRQLPSDSVDEEFGNVTMSMDFREGGGGGKSLHKMCDQLDTRGVPYVVRELKIADYIFFVNDKLAPILIERKTADDLAGSLHDGRWERQQRSMRKAQYVLGGGEARKCQICYIIEGDANKRKVHGGNVGRRSWFQSVEDVENAIESLPSLGFSVMRSKGHLDTIGILAKVAADVSWKVKNGVIDVEFTYQQFLRRVKDVSNDKGDPPTSREHQNPAPPIVVANHNSQPAPSPDNVNGNDGDVPAPHADQDPRQNPEENSEVTAELNKLSIQVLKDRCKERGEKIGGKKADLIARLLKPRKPEILLMRMRRNEYVPKVPSSNAALLVALLLHHIPGTQGMTKERLMVLAEETGVSKESMSGDGGFYDGWSGMKQLLEGDPALVRREKGHRYSLTTQPPESAGIAVASALHLLAHREGYCTCGSSPE